MLLKIGMLIFAAVFFVVGAFRIVEIKAAGMSGGKEKLLIALHLIGCAALTAAMVLLALNLDHDRPEQMKILFFGAILILFPLHIFINIKRRIRLSR